MNSVHYDRNTTPKTVRFDWDEYLNTKKMKSIEEGWKKFVYYEDHWDWFENLTFWLNCRRIDFESCDFSVPIQSQQCKLGRWHWHWMVNPRLNSMYERWQRTLSDYSGLVVLIRKKMLSSSRYLSFSESPFESKWEKYQCNVIDQRDLENWSHTSFIASLRSTVVFLREFLVESTNFHQSLADWIIELNQTFEFN